MGARGARRILTVALLAAACLTPAVFALAPDQACFHSGGVNPAFLRGGFPAPPNSYGVKGRIDTTSSAEFVFDAGRKGAIAIPYAAIASITYGGGEASDKPPRYRWSELRYGGARGPHKNYLHLFEIPDPLDPGFTPNESIFELGRDVVRPTLQALERSTGRSITARTVEACLQFRSPVECGYGEPRELKGTRTVFVDVSGYGPSVEESYQRITSEIDAARIGVRLVPDAESADMILAFHYHNGCNVPSPNCGPDWAQGEVYVVRPTGLLVVLLYDQQWYVYRTGLATRFARAFVTAYKTANGVK